jgi:transposase
MHAWADDGAPVRLVQQAVPKDDPDPKALACYGLLVRWVTASGAAHEQTWLRFVEDRPISGLTIAFLAWSCHKLEALGKTALLLVWDRASWHRSAQVRQWITHHNRQVKHRGLGVRIVACPLPRRSPWLNPIEPTWMHSKRCVAEADGLLTARALAQRVCDDVGCAYEEHLTIPAKVS